MNEELKGCPFCGSKAVVIFESGQFTDKHGTHKLWTVGCAVCGAGYDGLLMDYERVVRHWNRRA